MAKKSKKSNVSNVSDYERPVYPIPLPDVANMDDLAYVSDDELAARHTGLDADRNKIINHHFDPIAWEIELAYVKRELAMRRIRREAHDVWTREMYKQLVAEEANLPSAEFDNTCFMVS